MDYLRSEYVEIVDRWNQLSSQRDRLMDQLQIFEETRGDLPPSIGEISIRQQLAQVLDDSLTVAHRGSQLAEMRQLFHGLRARRTMLRNQQHWFENTKQLRTARMALQSGANVATNDPPGHAVG